METDKEIACLKVEQEISALLFVDYVAMFGFLGLHTLDAPGITAPHIEFFLVRTSRKLVAHHIAAGLLDFYGGGNQPVVGIVCRRITVEHIARSAI